MQLYQILCEFSRGKRVFILSALFRCRISLLSRQWPAPRRDSLSPGRTQSFFPLSLARFRRRQSVQPPSVRFRTGKRTSVSQSSIL